MDTTPYFIGILTHSRIQAAALISHVWPQPITWHASLFYLNRYIGMASNLAATFLYFTVRPLQERSVSYQHQVINMKLRISFPIVVLTLPSVLFARPLYS
ncbi:hypothetical protein BC827DRAFT_231029 [Russula dissimulans]|nr:hypothetical protein BC827DRAFT_231029 [Russula dissimulans]